MNKIEWKEARKYYSRRKILYYWTKWKLRKLKYYCFHLWFKVSRYEHKCNYDHSILTCSICRKTKMDIDRERIDNY